MPKILIVDDNAPTRDLLKSVLVAKGYTVLEAENGAAAIHLLKRQSVDAALVDHSMTPMNGFEFAQYLINHEMAPLPMALMTAHDFIDLLSKATQLGFVQIIKKPIAPDRLLQTIERLLRKSDSEFED